MSQNKWAVAETAAVVLFFTALGITGAWWVGLTLAAFGMWSPPDVWNVNGLGAISFFTVGFMFLAS